MFQGEQPLYEPSNRSIILNQIADDHISILNSKPILFISSDDSFANIEWCSSLDKSTIIIKPISLNDLVYKANQLIAENEKPKFSTVQNVSYRGRFSELTSIEAKLFCILNDF